MSTKNHTMPFALTIIMIAFSLITFVCLADDKEPTELAVFMTGQIFTGMLAGLGYFVGTTQSSREKTKL